MAPASPPSQVLLTIAGFDPSSGAGISLDLKVFQSFGFYGTALITALTVQNTTAVSGIRSISSDFFLKQYHALESDMKIAGIKVGMLGTAAHFAALSHILTKNRGKPIVIDPILHSTSGMGLLPRRSLDKYLEVIQGKAALITPNIKEAEKLGRISLHSLNNQETAAFQLADKLQVACLITGGLFDNQYYDVLAVGGKTHIFSHPRINKRIVHGTGCFLSSAVLALLTLGKDMPQACQTAARLTAHAIKTAVSLGKGQDVIDPGSLSLLQMKESPKAEI